MTPTTDTSREARAHVVDTLRDLFTPQLKALLARAATIRDQTKYGNSAFGSKGDAELMEQAAGTIERILAFATAEQQRVPDGFVLVPRTELQDFADVISNLIGELSDPGSGAMAAQYRIQAMLAALQPHEVKP